MKAKFLAFSMVIVGCFSNVFAQDQFDNLPRLMPSTLIADLQKRVKAAPSATVAELADFANKNLATKGFEFSVDPCDTESIATKIKYPEEYDGTFFHSYALLDTAGKGVKVLAREPGDAPCGCWLNLPVTSATKKQMTLISTTGPITVQVPEKFLVEEMEMVDTTLRKTTVGWAMPNGGPPDAVSTDGRKLYLEIEETPLYLEISLNGALRFVPRTTSGIIKEFTDLTKFPVDPDNAYLGFRRFASGRKRFTFKFSHVCT